MSREAMPEKIVNRLAVIGTLEVGQVFGRRVLVQLVQNTTEVDKYEKSGIVIPESAKKDAIGIPITGVILKVGNDADPKLQPGMAVAFSKYAGSALSGIKKDSRFGLDPDSLGDLKILDENEILCSLIAPEGDLTGAIVPVVG